MGNYSSIAVKKKMQYRIDGSSIRQRRRRKRQE